MLDHPTDVRVMLVTAIAEVRAPKHLVLMDITPVMIVQGSERAELSRTEKAIVPAILVPCEFRRVVFSRGTDATAVARISDETIRVGDDVIAVHPDDESAESRSGETRGTIAAFDVEDRIGDGEERLVTVGTTEARNPGDLVLSRVEMIPEIVGVHEEPPTFGTVVIMLRPKVIVHLVLG